MSNTTIINYPGNKKKLLNFIYSNTFKYIDKNKYVLDIFSGTGSVAEMYSDSGYKVISNDVEKYAYNISTSTICERNILPDKKIFFNYYNENKSRLFNIYENLIAKEKKLVEQKSSELIQFYEELVKIWQINDNQPLIVENIKIESIEDLNKNINKIPFMLFTLYYSSSYFGLEQSIEIDSIRYAIKKTSDNDNFLLSCLYYTMKECVFSKDGHMAQPLDKNKNFNRLLKVRNKNAFEIFKNEVELLINTNNTFADKKDNKTYNMNFESLLEEDFIKNNVGFIYADPPYTDMQYSRYFHLLNTVSNYEYPNLTMKNNKLTTGLYAENRYQSELSSKSSALKNIEKLIAFSAKNNINIAISYAYPLDLENQKSDRYTMNIEELISCMKKYFKKTKVFKEEYEHSNNRNSKRKKVIEYIILGYTQKKEEISYTEINKIDDFKKEVSDLIATNKSPLYNTMLYWSQKPYNITDIILNKFSKENDIILDPFMGSGVTLIESLKSDMNRNAIGFDINEFPIFLCNTILCKHNILNFININKDIKKSLKKYYQEYYTKCPLCNDIATIDKIIFDKEPSLILKEVFYHCNCSKGILSKEPDKEDIKNFLRERKNNNLDNFKLLENSRLGVKGSVYIKDLFTNRSFYILDIIYEIINNVDDEDAKKLLNYTFASIIHKSKIVDKKLSSQWPLWTPKRDCVERNVIDIFIDSLEKTTNAIKYTEQNYNVGENCESFEDLKNSRFMICKKAIQNVSSKIIPDESVDMVITDPPYLGQVVYSEYMQLYYSFLNTKIDYENEIVISNAKTRKKDMYDYLLLLDESFKNINRMMKNNSYLFMYFHDSNLKIWSDLINILKKNNFVFISSVHINKNKLTLKKIIDPKKTMNGETLIILKKDESNTWKKNEKDLKQIVEEVKDITNKLISSSPLKMLTTSELYDNGVLEYIIKNDYLQILSEQYKDLIDIFEVFLDWDSENISWKIKQ